MTKEVVRSGVTFDRKIYSKLDKIVENSKRYKIDKSEIVNAVIAKSNLSTDEIQKMVMEWREGR